MQHRVFHDLRRNYYTHRNLERPRETTANTSFTINPACREADLSLLDLPRGRLPDLLRGRSVATRACQEADLSLPGLPRDNFVTTRLADRQFCHYPTCAAETFKTLAETHFGPAETLQTLAETHSAPAETLQSR